MHKEALPELDACCGSGAPLMFRASPHARPRHAPERLSEPSSRAATAATDPPAAGPGRRLKRARFLAHASRVLAQSLDYEATLETVAKLATPELGAWVLVDLVEEDGTVRRLAVVHPDPAKQTLARALERG